MKKLNQIISAVASAFVVSGSAAYSQTADLRAGQWGDLKGRFVFGDEGVAIPNANPLKLNKAVQICGKKPLFDESLVVNPESRGIANVILWAHRPTSVHASYEKTAKDIMHIDNKQCRFEPHVLAFRTTQTLRIGNLDPFGHNALVSFLKNESKNPLIPAGGKVDYQFPKAEIIPVSISCSIHPWMRGYLFVQDHPYIAVTDADGKFEFRNLPVGKLTIKVWHERVGYVQEVEVDGQKAAWKKGRYVLNVEANAREQHEYRLDPKLFAEKR